jgi:uncharacterized YccA/Bax inhibitor family protein
MSVRAASPALSDDVYRTQAREGGVIAHPMTVEGTVNKTLILLLLCVISASFTWSKVLTPNGIGEAGTLAMGGIFGAMMVGWATIFFPKISPYTAPIYAVLEGLGLGALSCVFNLRYPGIATQAVGLTFGVLFVMLMAYRTGLVKVTDKLRMGIVAATGSIVLFMFAAMLLNMFGAHGPATLLWASNSPLAIGISVVILAVAAFNLLLDFDQIERGAAQRAPAFMEWYSAFGLMLTLIWLYIRFLQLLSQLNGRR